MQIYLAEDHYEGVVVTYDWNARTCGQEILNLMSEEGSPAKKIKTTLRCRQNEYR